MLMQSPRRPPGFYTSLLTAWSDTAVQKGLTESETFLCAAQLCGMVIAKTGGKLPSDDTLEQHQAMLETAAKAMRTYYLGQLAKRYHFGTAVRPNPGVESTS